MNLATALGRELGLSDETIEAVADWRETDRLTDDEKLVIEYAEVLTHIPVNVDDDLYERLRRRFSDKQLVQLTHAVALENARARFNRGFRITADGYTRRRQPHRRKPAVQPS